jgi:hypothetical protein
MRSLYLTKEKADLVMGVFLGLCFIAICALHLYDVTRAPAAFFQTTSSIVMAFASSGMMVFLSAVFITWSILKYRWREKHNIWEKFQIPE